MNFNPEIHHRRSIRLKGYDYSQEGLYFITICTYERKCIFGKIGAGTSPARTDNGVGAGTSPARTDNVVGAGLVPAQANNGVEAGINPAHTDVGAGLVPAHKAEMILNDYGKIAYNEWINLRERFSNLELDVFQIMPNHMHGIIIINEKIENIRIGNIIGAYKSLVSRGCMKLNNVGAGAETEAGINPARTDIGVGAGLAPAQKNDDVGAGNGAGINPAHTNEGAGINPARTKKGIAPARKDFKIWHRNYYDHIIRNEESYCKISEYIINNPTNWRKDKYYF